MRNASLALVMSAVLAGGAMAQDADPALTELGAYVATAADCSSCHGPDMKGGAAIGTPIGPVYASNITPDKQVGIGNWSLAQFSDAVRRGRGPSGHLYPAMPYTSYTAMSDDDVKALYSYLMLDVKPDPTPAPETSLEFPFVRPAMIVWNMLFFSPGRVRGAVTVEGAQLSRGKELVETFGHCSSCHTPRGNMMEEDTSRHLAGGMVGGWWAPNITPDKTGIGDWSSDELVQFLRTGHNDRAVAGGDMGLAISRSLSRLTQDDTEAMAAYLKAVPAIAGQVSASADAPAAPVTNPALIEPVTSLAEATNSATTDGALLYQNACASCHGVAGKGSVDRTTPSLATVSGVLTPEAATLVQVIAHGIDRQIGSTRVTMPGFAKDFTDAQIAAVANYVRSDIAGVAGGLDETKVRNLLDGVTETPWLIRNAEALAFAAIAAALIIVLALLWLLLRRRKRLA